MTRRSAASGTTEAHQLSLPLFDPPSFEEVAERKAVSLTIEFNPRMKNGWRVTGLRGDHHRTLTVPAALARAPAEVKTALVEWATLPFPGGRRSAAVGHRRRQLEREVRDYLESTTTGRTARRAVDPVRLHGLARGQHYDLRGIFDGINEEFFGGRLDSFVKWGAAGSVTSYQTFRTDRDGNRRSVITIAGVYDSPLVPLYAVKGVLLHEMLHIAFPPSKVNGRNRIHGPEFSAAERRSPYFAPWRAWERANLPALARAARLQFHPLSTPSSGKPRKRAGRHAGKTGVPANQSPPFSHQKTAAA